MNPAPENQQNASHERVIDMPGGDECATRQEPEEDAADRNAVGCYAGAGQSPGQGLDQGPLARLERAPIACNLNIHGQYRTESGQIPTANRLPAAPPVVRTARKRSCGKNPSTRRNGCLAAHVMNRVLAKRTVFEDREAVHYFKSRIAYADLMSSCTERHDRCSIGCDARRRSPMGSNPGLLCVAASAVSTACRHGSELSD